MKASRIVSLIGVLGAVSLFGAGCNPVGSIQQSLNQKVSTAVTQGLINKLSNGKLSVDANGNQMTVNDNTAGYEASYGQDVKIPSDFPKDIPVYPGAKPITVTVSKTGDQGASLTMQSTDDPVKIAAWYDDQLKTDWKQETSFSSTGTEVRSYSKQGATISVTITVFENDKETMISVDKTLN